MNVVFISKRAIALVSVLTLLLLVSFPAFAAPPPSCPSDRVLISGGTLRIGSDVHYPEERTADEVRVSQFCIDKYEVINAQFAEFVKTTVKNLTD